MFFPTFEFFVFFAVVLVLNWALKKWPLAWRVFLLSASYFFYLLWGVQFLLILVFASLFNFIAGRLIARNWRGSARFVLGCGVVANIGVLGFFKYYDFFRLSVASLLQNLGLPASLPFLEIVLPIGISFYIFRAIAYLVDVYQKKLAAEKSWLDFFIYLSFFPYLLAGPIARAGDFLSQLKNGGQKRIDNLGECFTLIFLGLFKKLVLSSFLVLSLTDDVFMVPQNHSVLGIALAILAYTLVIYFDFSGYSDLAVGFAGLLGFHSPINFQFPYLATSVKDFWRRWHISLSSWIKDYVYIPLGGNRKGAIRKHFNLIVAMTLAGLWHGAAWQFVLWGFWHGIGSSINHLWFDWRVAKKPALAPSPLLAASRRFLSWLLTFIFVAVGWVFFRSGSLENASQMLVGLFNFSRPLEPLPLLVIITTAFGLLFLFVEPAMSRFLTSWQNKMPKALWLAVALILTIILFKLGPDTVPPFIYFSF